MLTKEYFDFPVALCYKSPTSFIVVSTEDRRSAEAEMGQGSPYPSPFEGGGTKCRGMFLPITGGTHHDG